MDAVTGLAYRASADFSAVGEGFEIAELTTLITGGLHEAGAQGELESVVVTSTRTHEVILPVPGRAPLNTAVLAVALDRGNSNLALAVRESPRRLAEETPRDIAFFLGCGVFPVMLDVTRLRARGLVRGEAPRPKVPPSTARRAAPAERKTDDANAGANTNAAAALPRRPIRDRTTDGRDGS